MASTEPSDDLGTEQFPSPAAAEFPPSGGAPADQLLDAVVVGAGFAGLYMVKKLVDEGKKVVGVETAEDVGGTWYWNRYPGARCDIPTTDYCFTFDPELDREWTWSEKYATQPEILKYIQFVADKYDLRRHFRFGTRMSKATWDEERLAWTVELDSGDRLLARYVVMASGVLSSPKKVDLPGVDNFRGRMLYTSNWPHEGVDFTGMKVAVIGTGSTGIQAIPLIAEQARELVVFQRTPNFSWPANNGPAPAERLAALAEDRDGYRDRARRSRVGLDWPWPTKRAEEHTPEQQRARFHEAVSTGVELAGIQGVFSDQIIKHASNEIVAGFVRERIRGIVQDPQTAEDLTPVDHALGAKRPALSTNYYETYNRPNVRLLNVRRDPIVEITETGIQTASEHHDFDAIVFATGFDAMTGALTSVDIEAKGQLLRDKWQENGPLTYLGLMVAGYPNLFTITGPGSPSVQTVMTASIEQHVEWITGRILDLEATGYTTIEPTPRAEKGWAQHVRDNANITLLPEANSWYIGANVPGKPRVFMPYTGGLDVYRDICNRVVSQGYVGFRLDGPNGSQENDEIIEQVQPDAAKWLREEAINEPNVFQMSPAQLRSDVDAQIPRRPRGPQIMDVSNGELPGPAGPLSYRVYRNSEEPRPIIMYLHGGGWTLGSLDSDDPLCRDLCARTDAIVVSVEYRLAPEAPFPAAVNDAQAAAEWIAENAWDLGGTAGGMIVAGHGAGANLAAAITQLAQERGTPYILGQVLMNPVVDTDFTRPSYLQFGEGHGLTADLMKWFWSQYVPTKTDRTDPRVALLNGKLAGLPPAIVTTAELDPLRDEGRAYANALQDAGVPVTYLNARGQIHDSLALVDIVYSAAQTREQIAETIRDWIGITPTSNLTNATSGDQQR